MFAKLILLVDIRINSNGNILSAGYYFLDANGDLWQEAEEKQISLFGADYFEGQFTKLVMDGKPFTFANLIFCIGEYMRIPETADKMLNNYFGYSESKKKFDPQNIIIPTEIVQPIDKITRSYFENKLIPNTQMIVESSNANSKYHLEASATVSLMELPPGVKISLEPTQFDNLVFTAVCSLCANKITSFTGNEVYKIMTGKTDIEAPAKMLADIDESWTRMTSTKLQLNTGTVGDAYNFAQYTRDRRIIEGGKDKLVVSNQFGTFERTVYTLLEPPTLLEYAQLLKQISRFPITEQNTPINKNLEILTVQNTLLSHIHAIPNISNSILYESIYKRMDFSGMKDAHIKTKKKRTRELIHKMLDYWKSQNIITSWEETKKGNSFHSIIVHTPNEKKSLPKKTH